MARGSQNGISNNPNGRKAGSNQKLSLSLRSTIIDEVNNNFNDYITKLKSLQDKDYVRCMTELIKLVVPRPLNEEESNAMNINSEFIKRLFDK